MKKIFTLLVGLMMLANVAFGMTGYVDVQSVNGVYAGMLPEEVVAKWGQPLQKDYNTYYFNPGGLSGRFFAGKDNQTYLIEIVAKNPQLVLQPSGLSVGMSAAEVFRRLGQPDRKQYLGYDYSKNTAVYCYEYVTPEYTNSAGRKGIEEISFYVDENANRITKIELQADFYAYRQK